MTAATTLATGGAAAPAWIAWLAAHPGTVAVTCGPAVEAALIIVEKFSGVDSDPGDENDDSDADSDDTDPPTLDDVKEAEDKFKRGELKKDVLTRIQNEYDRAQGWADACAALGR